jgi:hypothetical protein
MAISLLSAEASLIISNFLIGRSWLLHFNSVRQFASDASANVQFGREGSECSHVGIVDPDQLVLVIVQSIGKVLKGGFSDLRAPGLNRWPSIWVEDWYLTFLQKDPCSIAIQPAVLGKIGIKRRTTPETLPAPPPWRRLEPPARSRPSLPDGVLCSASTKPDAAPPNPALAATRATRQIPPGGGRRSTAAARPSDDDGCWTGAFRPDLLR